MIYEMTDTNGTRLSSWDGQASGQPSQEDSGRIYLFIENLRGKTVSLHLIEPGIHHPPEEGREERQEDHDGVRARQLGAILDVFQLVVRALAIDVVLAVKLQVHDVAVGDQPIRVP